MIICLAYAHKISRLVNKYEGGLTVDRMRVVGTGTELPAKLPVVLQRTGSPASGYRDKQTIIQNMLGVVRPGDEVQLPFRMLKLGEGGLDSCHSVYFREKRQELSPQKGVSRECECAVRQVWRSRYPVTPAFGCMVRQRSITIRAEDKDDRLSFRGFLKSRMVWRLL